MWRCEDGTAEWTANSESCLRARSAADNLSAGPSCPVAVCRQFTFAPPGPGGPQIRRVAAVLDVRPDAAVVLGAVKKRRPALMVVARLEPPPCVRPLAQQDLPPDRRGQP